MSPNVGNFVHDLVEMAKAMETLPIVEGRVKELENLLNISNQHNQGLESNIIAYKQQIEDLNTKVRSLEVERDDASFRVLEAEDREHTATAMARSIASAVGNLVNTLDPPKPQPEPIHLEASETEKNAAHAVMFGEGSSGTDPTVTTATVSSGAVSQEVASTLGERSTTELMPPQDQSASDPTAKAETTSSEIASSASAPSLVADTSAGISEGLYNGRLYHDVVGYVSRPDWLEGGGTNENYDWRPGYSTNG